MKRLTIALLVLLIGTSLCLADWTPKNEICWGIDTNEPSEVIKGPRHYVTWGDWDAVHDFAIYYGEFLDQGEEVIRDGLPQLLFRASDFGLERLINNPNSLNLLGNNLCLINGGYWGYEEGVLLGTIIEHSVPTTSILPIENFTMYEKNCCNFDWLTSSFQCVQKAQKDGGVPSHQVVLNYSSRPPQDFGILNDKNVWWVQTNEGLKLVKFSQGKAKPTLLDSYQDLTFAASYEDVDVIPNGPDGLWYCSLSPSFELMVNPIYVTGPAGWGQVLHEQVLELPNRNYLTAFTYYIVDYMAQSIWAQLFYIEYDRWGRAQNFVKLTENIAGGFETGYIIPEISIARSNDLLFMTWDVRHDEKTDVWYAVYDLGGNVQVPAINLTKDIYWNSISQHNPKIIYNAATDEVTIVLMEYESVYSFSTHHAYSGVWWIDPQFWSKEKIYEAEGFFSRGFCVKDNENNKASLTFCEWHTGGDTKMFNCRQK